MRAPCKLTRSRLMITEAGLFYSIFDNILLNFTMNDGSSQRSPLSSYRLAKADDESDQSEKVSMIDKDVKPSIDTAPAKIPVPNAKESIKGDKISPFPSHGAVTGNPDLAKALLGGEELSADFDMSMVPMAFPQRVSATTRHVEFYGPLVQAFCNS